MCVIGISGFCCGCKGSVGGAVIVRCGSRDHVLLEMPWSTSSSPTYLSEDDTGRVGASEGGGEA